MARKDAVTPLSPWQLLLNACDVADIEGEDEGAAPSKAALLGNKQLPAGGKHLLTRTGNNKKARPAPAERKPWLQGGPCCSCGVTTSPAWRRGHQGQTLCNRCGVEWRRRMKQGPNSATGRRAAAAAAAATSRLLAATPAGAAAPQPQHFLHVPIPVAVCTDFMTALGRTLAGGQKPATSSSTASQLVLPCVAGVVSSTTANLADMASIGNNSKLRHPNNSDASDVEGLRRTVGISIPPRTACRSRRVIPDSAFFGPCSGARQQLESATTVSEASSAECHECPPCVGAALPQRQPTGQEANSFSTAEDQLSAVSVTALRSAEPALMQKKPHACCTSSDSQRSYFQHAAQQPERSAGPDGASSNAPLQVVLHRLSNSAAPTSHPPLSTEACAHTPMQQPVRQPDLLTVWRGTLGAGHSQPMIDAGRQLSLLTSHTPHTPGVHGISPEVALIHTLYKRLPLVPLVQSARSPLSSNGERMQAASCRLVQPTLEPGMSLPAIRGDCRPPTSLQVTASQPTLSGPHLSMSAQGAMSTPGLAALPSFMVGYPGISSAEQLLQQLSQAWGSGACPLGGSSSCSVT